MKSVQTTTTTSVVPAQRLCPRCGAMLDGFGPEGMCGACLLGTGLDGGDLAEAPAAGSRRFGDYELLEEIARGGMGVVYRARQPSLNRVVALKTLIGGVPAGAEEVRRFRVEAEAAAQLKHPNIVGIHEVGEHDGQPFFSMDFIEGQTLRQLTRDNPLPARDAAALLKTVAEAVHYAHGRGVIHRDLKPSNVLVDAGGQPHITDFGLAKRIDADAELTVSGMVMGTPSYMPPEQASGQNKTVGPAADVYALGAVLYDLLTGRPPFRAATPLETMNQVMKDEAVAPRLLNASVPRDLETVCLKCLEKDPTRRYDTAHGFAMDLQRFLANEPVSAAAPSAAYRFGKFARRNKTALGVAAAFAGILIAATVASTWQAVRAIRAEDSVKKRIIEVAAERDKKEQALQESEALSAYLVEVFQSPNPARDGRTITVAETVDQAARELDLNLANQPARRAKMQTTLGLTYHALGLSREAIPLLEQARNYYLVSHGLQHPDTIKAMFSLGVAYTGAGRVGEALKLDEEVLQLSRKINGPEHADTILAMSSLAASSFAAGRREEALKMKEEVLLLSRKVNGPEHPDTLRVMNNLANSYDTAGRLPEALKLREEVLALRRKRLGSEHPATLSSMHSLADSYFANGRGGEANKLREEVLALRRQVNGPQHPDTLATMHNLAISYFNTGRREEAHKLGEDLLLLSGTANGLKHPMTIRARFTLADFYHVAGRLEEELKMREEVLSLSREVLGSEHPDTLGALTYLASSCAALGRQDEAMKLREEVLATEVKVHGPEHPNTLAAINNVTLSYFANGRRDDALRMREELLPLSRKVHGSEHPFTLMVMVNLASSYSRAERREEALALREAVLTLRRKVLGPDHPDTLKAMDYLADSYRTAGREEEALKLREESAAATVSKSRSVEGPPLQATSSDNQNQKYSRADNFYRQGRYALAEPLYRELWQSQLKQFPTTNEAALGMAASLARNLSDWAWAERASTNQAVAYAHALEAEHLLRDCFAARQRGTNANHWRTVDVRSRLGFARVAATVTDGKIAPTDRAARFTEAEPLLLESATALQAETRVSAAYRRDSLERLVRLYEAWPNPDQAARWRNELTAFEKAEGERKP